MSLKTAAHSRFHVGVSRAKRALGPRQAADLAPQDPSAGEDLLREIDLGLKDIEKGRVSAWDSEEIKGQVRQSLEHIQQRVG
jgi:hypothetical protein